jgi:AsmA protein
MARPLKYFLIILGLFVLAVAGALTAAVMTFDPNDYRERIGKIVHDKTGRDLKIGDIKLTVFPVAQSRSETALAEQRRGLRRPADGADR